MSDMRAKEIRDGVSAKDCICGFQAMPGMAYKPCPVHNAATACKFVRFAPSQAAPDYAELRKWAESCSCWDYACPQFQAQQLLQSQPAPREDKWIAVEKQPPPHDTPVLVWDSSGYSIDWIDEHRHDGPEWAGDSPLIPLYWQPLPESPLARLRENGGRE